MYIQQMDYRSPGVGGLAIVRTYNSKNQFAVLFGYGWSSLLDEWLISYGPDLLRLNMPDGRAIYFAVNNQRVDSLMSRLDRVFLVSRAHVRRVVEIFLQPPVDFLVPVTAVFTLQNPMVFVWPDE